MDDLLSFLLVAPGILFGVTIHEYAHGYVADRLGDPTPRLAGRLTFNPFAHLDLIGTLMLFLARIGWAKPVPINPYNLRHPKEDMVWIALAGPACNFIFALLLGMLLRFLSPSLGGMMNWFALPLSLILIYGVAINLILAFFNFIPIPPLDGSKILMGILPTQQAIRFSSLERYGPFLLIGIVLIENWLNLGLIRNLVFPFVRFFGSLFTGLDFGRFF